MAADTLLTNARIIDGTGVPWYRGAVSISDGSIETVFSPPEPDVSADKVVDLEEEILAPGFIDTHSHSDLEVLRTQVVEPKIRQGVTTEIVGQDGLSLSPIESEDRDRWSHRMAPLAGTYDGEWEWESVEEYLDTVDNTNTAMNVGTLVGHGTVRYSVLSMSDESPSAEELEEMADLVAAALDDGAIGFSTGLVYPPQVHSDTEEVQRLASELHGRGKPFVAHVRGEARNIWAALDEFIDIGDEEGIPLHVSHFKLAGPQQHGKVDRALALLSAARERGVEITADAYPYTAGNTMLLSALPSWIQDGDTADILEALQAKQTRRRLKRAFRGEGDRDWDSAATRVGWENIVIANGESKNSQDIQGKHIAEISADRGDHPVDTLCDILIDEQLNVTMFIHHINRTDMEQIISHEWVAIATDGIYDENPHPRVYGTYPHVLGDFVRTRNLLSLEAAVRKMTALPAAAMRLHRKGLIQPGMDADLVVFSADDVASTATFDNPTRPPRGISDVLVNGKFVLRKYELTNEHPGDVIRH